MVYHWFYQNLTYICSPTVSSVPFSSFDGLIYILLVLLQKDMTSENIQVTMKVDQAVSPTEEELSTVEIVTLQTEQVVPIGNGEEEKTESLPVTETAEIAETAETAETTTDSAQIESEKKEEYFEPQEDVNIKEDESVAVVVWEATVTGRRLIDEMINLGSFSKVAETEYEFNEYVMPYGKLPLNVIRNYNLRIVDTGRYRMLKEIRNNKMLKSKSEVAACNDFAEWLVDLHNKFPSRKILLVYFEPRHSKILQLFQVCFFFQVQWLLIIGN